MKSACVQHPLVSSHGGFSLAEVLIALSITAFALLALVGVLPEGLRSLQNAQRQEAEARIVQQVAALHQLQSWDATLSENDLDFDANGAPAQSGSTDAVYRARAELTDSVPLPNESTASPYLRRLRIRIINQVAGGSFDNTAQYREKWVTLVNLDKVVSTTTQAVSTSSNQSTGTSLNP